MFRKDLRNNLALKRLLLVNWFTRIIHVFAVQDGTDTIKFGVANLIKLNWGYIGKIYGLILIILSLNDVETTAYKFRETLHT